MTRLVQSFKRLFQLFVGHISHICLNLNLLVICPTFISRYFVLESVIRGQCSPTHLFWSWRVFFWFWVFVLVSSVVLPSFKTNWFYKSSFSCLRRGKLVDSNSKNELLLYNAPFSFGRVFFVRLDFSCQFSHFSSREVLNLIFSVKLFLVQRLALESSLSCESWRWRTKVNVVVRKINGRVTGK